MSSMRAVGFSPTGNWGLVNFWSFLHNIVFKKFCFFFFLSFRYIKRESDTTQEEKSGIGKDCDEELVTFIVDCNIRLSFLFNGNFFLGISWKWNRQSDYWKTHVSIKASERTRSVYHSNSYWLYLSNFNGLLFSLSHSYLHFFLQLFSTNFESQKQLFRGKGYRLKLKVGGKKVLLLPLSLKRSW